MKNTEQTHTGQQNKNGVSANPRPTISLQDAINRASAWRTLLGKVNVSPAAAKDSGQANDGAIPPQLLFRAINISMNDINWLMQQHPDATSIRLYMSVPDMDYEYHITGMLVPVDAQNQDMLYVNSDDNMAMEDRMNDTSGSTIYDFTAPCPSMCNTTSPLFNSTNSPDPYLKNKNK